MARSPKAIGEVRDSSQDREPRYAVRDALPSDKEIIAAVLQGDQERYALLIRKYQGLVYTLVKRLCDSREDAEDLTQETFLRAFRNLDTFDPSRPFKPWIVRIASNLAISRRRARRPQESIDDPDSTLPNRMECGGISPVERLSRLRDQERLQSAIQQLEPEARSIIQLHYHEEMKLAEIAESMGRTTGSVKVALHRARLKLRSLVLQQENAPKRSSSDD